MVFLFACSEAGPPAGQGPVVVPASAAKAPAIVRLRARSGILTIHPGDSGPRYSVETEDGTVIAAQATEEELRRVAPDLYGIVRTARAENAYLDATLEPRVREAPDRGADRPSHRR
jgi:hypothetical protein